MFIPEELKFKIHKIDTTVNNRASKWILVCFSCQCERQVSYCQAWNVVKGKGQGNCFKCVDRSKNTKGRLPSIPWNKGKTWTKGPSDKQKLAMELNYLFDAIFVTEEGRKKQRQAKLGKIGKEANAFKHGGAHPRVQEMARDEYKQLRKNTFSRDSYNCQICLAHGGDLEMDHIKEWCNYPELRYEISNCRTLCKNCHQKTDNYGHKAKKLREVNVDNF